MEHEWLFLHIKRDPVDDTYTSKEYPYNTYELLININIKTTHWKSLRTRNWFNVKSFN